MKFKIGDKIVLRDCEFVRDFITSNKPLLDFNTVYGIIQINDPYYIVKMDYNNFYLREEEIKDAKTHAFNKWLSEELSEEQPRLKENL
ncbi:MAG: hypothetical protein ACTSV5_04340 [Promethearchaeota archaeon]